MISSINSLTLREISAPGRVLIAEAWDATPHLETGLEIGLRLAASNYNVDYCHYGKILPVCECARRLNLSFLHLLLGYTSTPASLGIRTSRRVAKQKSLPFTVIEAPSRVSSVQLAIDSALLSSIAALQQACFSGNTALGLSVASSLVSMTKNSRVIPIEYQSLVNDLATSFARSYDMANILLDSKDYEALIVFNGRFASVKGAVMAAHQRNIPIYYHERGSSPASFSLRKFQPHDRVAIQKEIDDVWNKNKSDSTIVIAKEFFDCKNAGTDKAWPSFKKEMIPGKARSIFQLAKEKSRTGKVICFFSSSEDEFISVTDSFDRSSFEWISQCDAFVALLGLAEKYGHSLVIRNHPHLVKKANADKSKWDNLEFLEHKHRVVIVRSDSNVDTNELIMLSNLVVVFGSTVGIEAVYAGKPAITLSDSFYDCIGASVYKPKSIDELDGLIASIDSLQTDPESALPYGYYFSVFGTHYQIYRPTGFFQGSFAGKDLGGTTKRHRLAAMVKTIFAKKILGRLYAKTKAIGCHY